MAEETVRSHARRTSRGRTKVRRHRRVAGPQLWRGATRVLRAGRSARARQLKPATMLLVGGVLELVGWLTLRLVGLVLISVVLLLGLVASGFGVGTATRRASGGTRRVGRRCAYCKQTRTLYPVRTANGSTIRICSRCKNGVGGGKRRPR